MGKKGGFMKGNAEVAVKFLEAHIKQRGAECKKLWDWCVDNGAVLKGCDTGGIWSKSGGWLAFAYGVGRV
jgi:hypothetical protein